MNFIAAVDENWNIGNQGNLLERIPEDMKQFKAKTRDKVVVMGRKTFESFPGKRPLPNRTNIVLTRQMDFICDGIIVCHSYNDLCDMLQSYKTEDIFIIGGGVIYNKMIPYCQTGYITKFHKVYNADTGIINLDMNKNWTVLEKDGPHLYKDDINYSYFLYKNNNIIPFHGV